ncbi:hypothetical protein BD626DRAFT_507582 [Schizophyllum amplum]|uniref:F-box domain-containing protein n=1 Tax=Schizophyllum amplum TaxID=97359 RepID=A0A550C451_9AGAR|nr:hypothetical protein BD626DRAFT_507582 [Auriculariopsis ampla]
MIRGECVVSWQRWTTLSTRRTHQQAASEILERIFLLTQPHYEDFVPKWPDRKSLQWLTITRVCARWRTVAINFSALWATIDLFGTTPRIWDALSWPDICHRYSARLAVLHLAVDNPLDCFFICNLFGDLPRCLHSLSLSTGDGGTFFHGWKHAPALLAQPLPTVRKLTLRNVDVGVIGAVFSDLTHLATYATSIRLHLARKSLWRLFKSSPRLEKLVLDSDLIFTPRSVDSGMIPLSRLRKLQLGGNAWHILDLLQISDSCDIRCKSVEKADHGANGGVELSLSSPLAPLRRRVHTVQMLAGHDILRMHVAIRSHTMCLAGIVVPDVQLVILLVDRLRATDDDLHTLTVVAAHPSMSHDLVSICDVLAPCAAVHLYGFEPNHILPIMWKMTVRRAQLGVPLREIHIYEDSITPRRTFPGMRQTFMLDASGAPENVEHEIRRDAELEFPECGDDWPTFEAGQREAEDSADGTEETDETG